MRTVDVIRIFDEMDPDEIAALPPGIPAIAALIVADTNLTMEQRRVAALLNQYGEHNATPDFQTHYHHGDNM